MKGRTGRFGLRRGWFTFTAALLFTAALVLIGTTDGFGTGGGFMGHKSRTEVKELIIAGGLPREDGIPVTREREIELVVTFYQGIPTDYIACEDPEFKDCEWKRLPFNGRIRFLLSEGSGIKTIYFRAKYLGQPGPVISAKVKYAPQ